MLTDHELREIRATVDKHLPGTAVLYSPTRTADGSGGETETWAAYGTVPCHVIIGRSPREDPATGEWRMLSYYSVVVPAATAIKARDRVVSDGATFEVTGYHGANDQHGCIRALVTRVGDA